MQPTPMKPKLTIAVKIILTGIFVFSGAMKLVDMESFQASVASFKVFPAFAIYPIAATVPPLEILAGLLLWSRMSGAAAMTLTGLCSGFAALYTAALILGISPDCGCFGDNPLLKVTPTGGLVRGLLLACLAGFVWEQTLPKGTNIPETPKGQ